MADAPTEPWAQCAASHEAETAVAWKRALDGASPRPITGAALLVLMGAASLFTTGSGWW